MDAERKPEITFLNQFFWPDEAATSQLLSDVVRRGAQHARIRVICGSGGYAAARFAGADAPQVEIDRVAMPAFGRTSWRRALCYAMYLGSASWKMLTGPVPDMVVSMTTPPFLAIAGRFAQLRGARHFIWEMDVYPDIAVELGVLRRDGLAAALLGRLADWPRKKADALLSLGPCMSERLRRRDIGGTRVVEVENWADGCAIQPQAYVNDGCTKIFYSGTMGAAHDFHTLQPALQAFGNDARFLFRFSGGGAREAWLRARCKGLSRCEFLPYWQRKELNDAFAAGDIGLVTQAASTAGAVAPSKLYGILAAGRAVLFVGPEDTTVARTIRQFDAGWIIPNGAPSKLIALLEQLHENPQRVREAGCRARSAFESGFDTESGVARVLNAIGLRRDAVLPLETETIKR